MPGEERVEVHQEVDILSARAAGKRLAQALGFTGTDLILIATAISEIARNLLEYGGGGALFFGLLDEGRKGLLIRAVDHGPGIADPELALRDGFTTGKGLGLGLPGARRLMDELSLSETPGGGTTVLMKKWVP